MNCNLSIIIGWTSASVLNFQQDKLGKKLLGLLFNIEEDNMEQVDCIKFLRLHIQFEKKN